MRCLRKLKRRLGRLCWMVVGGALLAACAAGSSGAPSGPTALPTMHLSQTPLVVQPPPTPTTTVYPPVERIVLLDTPIEGVYVPGQVRELYSYENDAPRRISIGLEARDDSGPLRLLAQVYSIGGTRVQQVSGQPLQQSEWDLTRPGEYIIQVFGPETQARAFVLTVRSRPIPEAGGDVIAYGQSRSGEIAARGQRDNWTFEGQAGDSILIMMNTPSRDSYLALYDPGGQLVAQSDDYPPLGQDAVLEVDLPVDGVYTIVARMYGDATTGTYRLVLEKRSEN